MTSVRTTTCPAQSDCKAGRGRGGRGGGAPPRSSAGAGAMGGQGGDEGGTRAGKGAAPACGAGARWKYGGERTSAVWSSAAPRSAPALDSRGCRSMAIASASETLEGARYPCQRSAVVRLRRVERAHRASREDFGVSRGANATSDVVSALLSAVLAHRRRKNAREQLRNIRKWAKVGMINNFFAASHYRTALPRPRGSLRPPPIRLRYHYCQYRAGRHERAWCRRVRGMKAPFGAP